MSNNSPYILLFFLFVLVACGDEAEVPVYLTVNTPQFAIAPAEGTDLQSSMECFVYHNTSLLGGFSYGNEIPVLASGQDEILVFAGIRKNTLVDQPDQYSMMDPDTLKMNFMPGEQVTISPTFRYTDNVKFRILDDFETGTEFTADLDLSSNTKLVSLPGIGYQDSRGGLMEVTSEDNVLIVASQSQLTGFPIGGDVILEMTFKSNTLIVVGINAIYNFGVNQTFSKVILNPSQSWEKVYIDLGPEIGLAGANAYQVFLSINHNNTPTLDTARAVVDDIKLLHR